jgi:hypothetical protein
MNALARRIPWLLAIPEERIREAALGFLAMSAVLGMAGGTWDAAWHVTLRRETFWTPPHLLLYGGTTLALGAALLGVAGAWVRGLSVWEVERGFAVAVLGALVVIGAAPVDDFWHRTFGRDVDVWSFPHLVALVGGCGINIGAALASRQMLDAGAVGQRWIRGAMLVFITALLWVTMFGLNWYTLVLARVRDSFEYPLLVALIAPPVLVVCHALWGRGGAVITSVSYTLYVIASHAFLNAVGFALLPFPPAVLAGAIGVDIILDERLRGSSAGARASGGLASWVVRAALAGALFVPLFMGAEAASLAWYPHPDLPPPRTEAMMGYLSLLAEHPWDWEHVLQAAPRLLLVGAIVGGFGGLIGWGVRSPNRSAS